MKAIMTIFGTWVLSVTVTATATEIKEFRTVTNPDDLTSTLSELVNETVALKYQGTNLAVLAVNNYQAKQITFVSYDEGRTCTAIVAFSQRTTGRSEKVQFVYGNGYGQVDRKQYIAPDLTLKNDDLNRVPGVILANCR